jgi:FtsZ-binding cell division protein ZapB
VRKKSLEDYQKLSPEIPSNTCPYIDFIQEIIREVKNESNSTFIDQKLELADSTLEYVRQSNEALRQSSHFWYIKFKSLRK